MINCNRINESVADVMRGFIKTPADIMEEVEKKLGKPVDEKKWNEAKAAAEKALGPLKQRSNRDRFYAYTMGVYKKMMGESEDVMAVRRAWRLKGREAAAESDPKKKAALKAEYEALEKKIAKLEGRQLDESEEEAEKEVEKIKDEKKEAIKSQPEGHDEEKEIEEDPTREKLETAKDEADERKGGPAELAADLRVSIRIEKMGIGRYKRMLSKHELSDADEKWLNQRIKDLEDCIKQMEAKVPELEKEAEEADKGKTKEEVKEAIVAGVRAAITELARG